MSRYLINFCMGVRFMKKQRQKRKSDYIHRAPHYNAVDINDRLIINLRDLSHIMRFLYEGKGNQKRILIILNEVGSITQRELTQRLGIQPGSASEVLSKLEDADLIERRPSRIDRRTADICLTEKGKLLALDAAGKRRRRHEEMFSCLADEEKQTLLVLLEKVYADWEQRYLDKNEE